MGNESLSGLKIDKTPSALPAKRRIRLWLAIAAAAALLLAWFARGFISPAIETEVSAVSLVYPSQTFTLLNASGYVVAQRKAAVASKATGQLVGLNVEEGSIVRRGEVIARLENADVLAARSQADANLGSARASLAQAQAELGDATLAFKRSRDLLARGYIAQTDFDTADARYRKAQAAVSGAESAITAAAAALRAADVAVEYTLIRAPFDAVVLTKNADVGDIVTPLGAAANAKAAVVTIADMGSLLAEVDVSESSLQQVRQGQPCEIQLDAFPDVRFSGKVHMIVPTADRSKASVMVKVRFLEPDRRVLPEMSAKVAFLERQPTAAERTPRVAVTPSAVVSRNARQVVFKVVGGAAAETPVEVGGRLGDMIEIRSGLAAGDRIVQKPTDRIRSGSRIRTAER